MIRLNRSRRGCYRSTVMSSPLKLLSQPRDAARRDCWPLLHHGIGVLFLSDALESAQPERQSAKAQQHRLIETGNWPSMQQSKEQPQSTVALSVKRQRCVVGLEEFLFVVYRKPLKAVEPPVQLPIL